MAATLEDRVRSLESSQYSVLGRINACQNLGVAAWVNIIQKMDGDPVKLAEELRSLWLREAENPKGDLSQFDPATIDLIGQEYMIAMDELTGQIVEFFQNQAPRGRPVE